MILFTLFIDAIFTDMGRFTFRALHFDFLHSYLYYATPKNLYRLEPISANVDVFWIGMKTPQSTSLKGD
jgi:hypothetical protein